jgi:hypothetical protein
MSLPKMLAAITLIAGIAVFTACSSPDETATSQETATPVENADTGFTAVFDGNTLDGWTAFTEPGVAVPLADSDFEVMDGVIHCTGAGHSYWIKAPGTYKDCIIKMQYKVAPGSNSGIFLRVPGTEWPAHKGYEVQVLDDSGQPPTVNTSGAVYDVLTPMRNMSRPAGEWNDVEITLRGRTVVINWNGFKIIDADFSTLTEPLGKWEVAYKDLPLEGGFGVQNHGGEVWYRNIEVKQLN